MLHMKDCQGIRSHGTTQAVLLLALFMVSAPVQAAEAGGAHRAGEVMIEARTARTPEGRTVHYELGTLFVPENRAAPNSRLIGVGFARLRAARPTGRPPIFLLPGGPGSSALSNFTESDAGSQRRLANFLEYYNDVGDLVVVDQRGFSRHGDVLEFSRPERPLDRPRVLSADAAELVKQAQEAVAAHPEKDLSGYTLIQCAADVNDLRRALGYEQIILTGQSFGSQWSFAVMRLHPEIVARAQLSAVEPLDYGYDMPSHVFAALQRIAWDADQDPGLAPYLPKGGVMHALRAVRDRLASRPVKLKVEDAKTRRVQTVTLGLEDFQDSLLMPEEDWPAFVLSLYHRHYDDWARSVIEQRKNTAERHPLIGPLIDTSLGVSAEREHLLRTDSGTELLGMGNFHPYIASASAWPTPDLGDEVRLAVPSSIPVLFIHGDWDTSTPIENTLNILPYFPNGRAIRVHRGNHGARKALFDEHPEVLEKVIEFLKTGEMRNLPVSVSLRAPVFRRPSFAPPPSRSPGR